MLVELATASAIGTQVTETSKQRSNMNPIYILNMTTLAAGLRMGWNAVRERVEEGILEVCNKGWRQQGLG